jgi:hypothetical protein
MVFEETLTLACCQSRYQRKTLRLQIRNMFPGCKGIQQLHDCKYSERDRRSIPGQSTWELWWAQWKWNRFIFCQETVSYAKKEINTALSELALKFERRILRHVGDYTLVIKFLSNSLKFLEIVNAT